MFQLGTDGLVLPNAGTIEFATTVSTGDATKRIAIHATAVLSIRVWKGASGLKAAIAAMRVAGTVTCVGSAVLILLCSRGLFCLLTMLSGFGALFEVVVHINPPNLELAKRARNEHQLLLLQALWAVDSETGREVSPST